MSQVSTAFQITVEINIYTFNSACSNIDPNSFKINVEGRRTLPSLTYTVPPGGALINLPSKYCYELPYVVFCLYNIRSSKHSTPKLVIEQLHFEFPNSNDCSFGGMQMLPSQIDITTRPTVICQPLLKLKSNTVVQEMELPFREYIPEEKTLESDGMALAFYSYTVSGRRGNMDKVTLRVTSSDCQAVDITCDEPLMKKTFSYVIMTSNTNYDNIRPSVQQEIMCKKHLPRTDFKVEWKWKYLRKLDRVLICHIYSVKNHSIIIVYPYRGTRCVMMNRLPRYGAVVGNLFAPRYENLEEIKTKYQLCGFNFISNLNTNYVLSYSHWLKEYNTHNIDRKHEPIGMSIFSQGGHTNVLTFNLVHDVTFFRDFYTLRFIFRDNISPLLTKPITSINIDSILNNVEPHSGSYILQDLASTLTLESSHNTNMSSYRRMSHYDIPFFHLYRILPRMTLQGNVSVNIKFMYYMRKNNDKSYKNVSTAIFRL